MFRKPIISNNITSLSLIPASKNTSFGRFFTSNNATLPFNNQKLNATNLEINPEKFFFHSVSGLDPYKLWSIGKIGIVPKAIAESIGIKIATHGNFENGENCVSVSTCEALSPGSDYAGDHLSVVIDPKGLDIFKPLNDNCPPHERQIQGQIPPQHIVGVMIPEAYFTKALRDLHIFNIHNKEILKINMINLDGFLQNQFCSSMLADPEIKKNYDEIISLKRSSLLDYFNYEAKMKQLSIKLNTSIMQFIEDQHKPKFNKPVLTAIDIIYYYTKDKYPLFKSSGECIKILPSEIEGNKLKK